MSSDCRENMSSSNHTVQSNWTDLGLLQEESSLYPAYTSSKLLQNTIMFVSRFGIPVIFLVGTTGNILCVLAFTCTRLKQQSSSIYLIFLAFVDTGFLLCLFIIWLGYVGFEVYNREGMCQLTLYFIKVFAFLSVWTLVAFTVERYIIVYHPIRRHLLCTHKRAKTVVFALILFALAFYSYNFKMSGIVDYPGRRSYCLFLQKYNFEVKILIIVDTVLTLIIPSLAITILNFAIGYKVRNFICMNKLNAESRNRRENKTVSNSLAKAPLVTTTPAHDKSEVQYTNGHVCQDMDNKDAISTVYDKNKLPRHLKHDFHLRTTRALLIVSAAFLLLHLPDQSLLLYATARYLIDEDYQYPRNMALWMQLLQFLFYTSFSTNCIVYATCNRSCRFALLRLLKGWFCKYKLRAGSLTPKGSLLKV